MSATVRFYPNTFEEKFGTPATGYSVIKANSHDAAVALAKGCPHLQSGGQITVYETMEM